MVIRTARQAIDLSTMVLGTAHTDTGKTMPRSIVTGDAIDNVSACTGSQSATQSATNCMFRGTTSTLFGMFK